MFGEVLGAVDAAVLAAGAAEANLQVGEFALDEAFDVNVDKAVDVVQEEEDFAVVFKELDDFLVHAVELAVVLVLARVVHGAAVEDVSAAVATGVYRHALLVGEAVDAYFQALVFCNLIEKPSLCRMYLSPFFYTQ